MGNISELPTTLEETSPAPPGQDDTVLYVVWQHGDVHCPAVAIEGPTLVAGRDPTCDIRVDSPRVSRRHLEIYSNETQVMVRDVGSRNGVHINGLRLGGAQPLSPGDVLRMGDCVAVVVRSAKGIRSWLLEDGGSGLMAGAELSQALGVARRVGSSDLPMVIIGATGTGKERVAHAVHGWSERRGKFCAVNCAALPASLAEAELFGYRKGAFTGAACSHEGHFREADTGTLFLDEIADLGLDIQAKLLRVVEEKLVRPLGDSRFYRVDVRILAAGQTSLDQLVAQGRFREDLARRLSGASLELPFLRKRKSEIVPLFRHFVARHLSPIPKLDPAFVETLLLYDWPGNVRELDLLVRRLALVHGKLPEWNASLLTEQVRSVDWRQNPSPGGTLSGLRAERAGRQQAGQQRALDQLRTALWSTGGNLTAAAARMGISRQRAYRLLRSSDKADADGGQAPAAGLASANPAHQK